MTTREKVAALYQEGRTTKEIQERLNIARSTVYAHLQKAGLTQLPSSERSLKNVQTMLKKERNKEAREDRNLRYPKGLCPYCKKKTDGAVCWMCSIMIGAM